MMGRRAGESMKLTWLILAMLLAVSMVSALSLSLDTDTSIVCENREIKQEQHGELERQREREREERERRERESESVDRRESQRERERREREERERERERERREPDSDERRESQRERERERRERERRESDDDRRETRREREREERERERRELDSDDDNDRRRGEGERERREREERERERRELESQSDDEDSRRGEGERERERREREERERERERRERREREQELDSEDDYRRRGEGERGRERREREERERERERRERQRRDAGDDRRESRREREREERERERRERRRESDDRRGGRDSERREREEREERERERRERHRDNRRERGRRFRGEGQRELQLEEPRVDFSSEAGEIRVWDRFPALEESEVYVNGARITLRQRGLLLPHYSDSSYIGYVEEGEGLVGLLSGYSLGETARRVRRGDVIAIPRGIAQWWYNSGNEELRIIALSDTSIGIERGDREYTPFALIGGSGEDREHRERRRGEGREDGLRSILHGFRREFLAEAWDADESEVDELLDSQRGVGIIRVERDIDIERALNVIDDTTSTVGNDDNSHVGQHNTHLLSEFAYNVRHGTPDVRVEDAGHFTAVNRFKLPILNIVRLGLTYGRLERNAIFAPHWSPNGHQIVHILRGSGRLEIVGNGGEQLVSQEVSEGDVFVIPRFHPAGARAGEEGLEWLTFYTTDLPYVEALAGKTSVYKNLPDQVAAAAFNIDQERVRELKRHRLRDALLLSPHGRSERRRRYDDQEAFDGSHLRFLKVT